MTQAPSLVSVDPKGLLTLAGTTTSSSFPTTRDAFDRTYDRGEDLFISRLSTRDVVSTTSYGRSCGPKLSALLNAKNQTVLTVAGAPRAPNGVALFIFGTKKLTVRLPGTSCFLLTDPLIGFPVLTNATGSARFSFPKPSGIFSFNAQALTAQVKTSTIATSQGLQVKMY